jgi:hypothetical protein
MSGSSGVSSELTLDGAVGAGWWLVAEDADGRGGHVLAGPYADRAEAAWDAATQDAATRDADGSDDLEPVYGTRRADGLLLRRPSPQDWAWLAHLGEQLERLPEDWDAAMSDSDPLGTLVVEVVGALLDAGFTLYDDAAAAGGICLTPDPGLDGVIVTWQTSDRLSIEQVRGSAAALAVAQAMTGALALVLEGLGYPVEAFGTGTALVVRNHERPAAA